MTRFAWVLCAPLLACSDDPGGFVSAGSDGPKAVDDTGDEDDSGGSTAGDTDTDTAPVAAGPYAEVSLEQAVHTGSLRSSALTWNGTRWIVAYVDVSDRFHVYVRALDPAGDVVSAGAASQIDDGGYDGFEAEIASASDGSSMVVYEDDRVGLGECCREIHARPVDVSGTPTGPSVNLTNNPSVEEFTPAIAWDSGVYYVTWSDDRLHANNDLRYLYGKVVQPDGSFGPELLLGGDSNWQTFGEVEGSGGAGRFLAVWGDYDDVATGLDCGYRARIVDTSGNAVTGVIDIARTGESVYDRPGVAWSPEREAWLVVWMQPYELHASWIDLDGRVTDLGAIVAPEEGAGSARLTWSPRTGTFLLAYHAWWTYDGWVQELDADGHATGERLDVNAATPPLGTFYVPIAARDDAAEALVAPSLDYARLTASLYRSR